MKKLIFLVLIIIAINSSTVKAQVYESKWQASQIIIDGNTSDWKTLPGYFNGETRILYETRNDSNNLYLIVEIPDQQMQVKAMRAGLKVTFNIKIKPKIKAQIVFPVIAKDQENFQQGERPDFEVTKQNYMLLKDYAAVEGFNQTKGNVAPLIADQKKLSFASDWNDKNDLCYEIRIPFNDLFPENYTYQDRSQTEIGIGISLLALPRPAMGADDYGSDNDMSQSGQTPYGNQMGSPHGNMNQAGNGMGVMFNEVGFHFKIKPSDKEKLKE